MGVANEDGVFLIVGAYASVDDAQADYEVVKELHANKVIGGFDAAARPRSCGRWTARTPSSRSPS